MDNKTEFMVNKKDLISIIIPVYNSEKYIHRILESIFYQTYSNFEIIFAYDEKTTDNSLKILQEHASNHPNIVIDISTDISPGCARNRGFKRASGEFVVFVDVDDFLHPNYLEYLHNIFVQYPELDVGFCNYSRVESNTQSPDSLEIQYEPMFDVTLYEQKEVLIHYINREIVSIRAAWPYMVRRKMLLDNNIHFSERRYAEDQYWVFHVLCNSPLIGYIPNKLYYYVQCQDSICHTIDWKSKFNDVQFVIHEITPLLSKIDSELRDTYYVHDTYEQLSLLAVNDVYHSVKTYLSKEKYKYIVSSLTKRHMSLFQKIFTKNIILWYVTLNAPQYMPKWIRRFVVKVYHISFHCQK